MNSDCWREIEAGCHLSWLVSFPRTICVKHDVELDGLIQTSSPFVLRWPRDLSVNRSKGWVLTLECLQSKLWQGRVVVGFLHNKPNAHAVLVTKVMTWPWQCTEDFLTCVFSNRIPKEVFVFFVGPKQGKAEVLPSYWNPSSWPGSWQQQVGKDPQRLLPHY